MERESMQAGVRARFVAEGQRAIDGARNPYWAGSAAASWWEEGRKAAADESPGSVFMRELLSSVETLCGVAEEHGGRTLADLFYLHAAIVNGGFVDAYKGESALLEIVNGLPSAERWAKFIKIEEAA